MTTHVPALGIDLAKSTFDVHLLTESNVHSRHLANTPPGFLRTGTVAQAVGDGAGACLHGSHRNLWRCSGPVLVPSRPSGEHRQSRTYRGLSEI